MRRASRQAHVPRNRRREPDAMERAKGRVRAQLRRILRAAADALLPQRLRTARAVSWGMNLRLAGRSLGAMIVVVWGVLTVVGFVRAWSLEGPYRDRARELHQVEQQLTESRAKTVLLESQLSAIDTQPEVRMAVIRKELSMVRPNERVVRFR